MSVFVSLTPAGTTDPSMCLAAIDIYKAITAIHEFEDEGVEIPPTWLKEAQVDAIIKVTSAIAARDKPKACLHLEVVPELGADQPTPRSIYS